MFITRTITASIAGALALAGVAATPARADNGDIARFLVGATALALIVNAANSHHNDRVVVTRRPVYVPAPRRRVIVQRRVIVERPVIVNRTVRRTVIVDRWGRHNDHHNGHHHDRDHNRWTSHWGGGWNR